MSKGQGMIIQIIIFGTVIMLSAVTFLIASVEGDNSPLNEANLHGSINEEAYKIQDQASATFINNYILTIENNDEEEDFRSYRARQLYEQEGDGIELNPRQSEIRTSLDEYYEARLEEEESIAVISDVDRRALIEISGRYDDDYSTDKNLEVADWNKVERQVPGSQETIQIEYFVGRASR